MGSLIKFGYWGILIAAYLAGTILPFGSEIVISGVMAYGANAGLCLLMATAGNFLGGLTNYWIGHMGKIEWLEKYLKVKPQKIYKCTHWLRDKGAIMGFFVFLPIVGDVIGISLGYARANFWIFSTSMLIGKAARFFIWIYATKQALILFNLIH